MRQTHVFFGHSYILFWTFGDTVIMQKQFGCLYGFIVRSMIPDACNLRRVATGQYLITVISCTVGVPAFFFDRAMRG